VGGAPVVIKLIEGTRGIGVLLAENARAAESIVERLQSQKQNVLIDKFVAESRGKDIRAFVVGDRVVAAMRRVAQGPEFRSNVHRGGKAEAIDLPAEFADAAIRTAQILGLPVAVLDMLESAGGPQIMGVNSSSGLEGIETCTQLDIAGAVVNYIAAQIEFPEIEVRQRRTVSKGYGVNEIYVPDGSKFVGKTIAEVDLSANDLNVLTLYRGNKVIPNPRGDRVLEPEDKLLCFGKLESMCGMVPERARRTGNPGCRSCLMPRSPSLKRSMSLTMTVVLGWRECVNLPARGTDRIKATVETGGRTACVLAFDVQIDFQLEHQPGDGGHSSLQLFPELLAINRHQALPPKIGPRSNQPSRKSRRPNRFSDVDLSGWSPWAFPPTPSQTLNSLGDTSAPP
jgi:hypothetical protein